MSRRCNTSSGRAPRHRLSRKGKKKIFSPNKQKQIGNKYILSCSPRLVIQEEGSNDTNEPVGLSDTGTEFTQYQEYASPSYTTHF